MRSAISWLGELGREGLRLALGEIDEDVGDIVGFGGQIDAGDDVGAVFRFGQARRLGVGGLVRHGVDRRSFRRAVAAGERIAVDRYEQLRAAGARQPHAIGERHESVVGARHHHAVFAGLFQLVAQHQGEIEHQRLFHHIGAGAGAGIDAAMARIEHHDRARIGRVARRRIGLLRRLARQTVVDGGGAQEGRAVDGREIEHQPCRLAVDGVENEGLFDPHRTGRVEHDARAAGHHQAEAERLDQSPPLVAGPGRELENDLRQVDDHTVGIGKGEGAQVDLLRQIDHEPRVLVVAAETHIGGDGKRRTGGGTCAALGDSFLRMNGQRRRDQRDAENGRKRKQACRADRHRIPSPSGATLRVEHAWPSARAAGRAAPHTS